MFVFELKMNGVWFTIVFLLLCFSVSPHSCYPQAEEDEDLTEQADHTLDNEEGREEAGDEEEESSQEEEDSDLEKDGTISNFNTAKTCVRPNGNCGPKHNPGRLLCCRDADSGDFFRCEKWEWVDVYYQCTRIRPAEVQNLLKELARQAKLP